MSHQNIRRATASSVKVSQELNASAHKRNSASAINMTKMPVNKRAFGVDVSNARKELNTVQNVCGTVGYKKNNYENVNPNVCAENGNPNVCVENVRGFNAPAVRPTNGAMITTRTQQVSLVTAKPASCSVAQATYPVNIAQAARPRALSKRAANNTIFRDKTNSTNVLPSIETESAPAPPAHLASVAPRQVQSQPALRVRPSTDGNEGEVINNQASNLAYDDLSPALARLSVSPSRSASPSQKVTVPTADGGEEVWDSEISEHSDDEYDQGYASAQQNTTCAAGIPVFTVHVPCGLYSATHDRMLQVAAAFIKKAYTAKDAEDDHKDITMAAEYADEIFAYMNEIEVKNIATHNYMEGFQTEVKPDMRRVLMDWLVQVHQRFNMLPETLYLCVNYIDRFLSSKVVSLGKLQLVGATAILLAAKIEEVNAPTIPEIVYMVDDTYGADEVIKAERFMLGQLDWQMQFPGPMSFLRRISKADDYDIEVRTMAKYFLEVSVMDYRFVSIPPSFAAAGAVCLARLMLMKGRWTPAHAHYSGYTGDQLLGVCCMLLDALRQDPSVHHSAVYEKYSHRRYNQYSVKAHDIVVGTYTGRPFSLPLVLDDGQIFDYEEQCDGTTAFYRASTMANLGMTEDARATCENIFRRSQVQDAQIRRQQQHAQTQVDAQAQAQAQALVSFAPYLNHAVPASFNPYPTPNTDEVSA